MAYKKGDSLIRKNPLFRIASHLTFYSVLPIAWLIFFGLYRGKVRGRWRIKDFLKENKNGKAIMVSNHTTFFDPILTSLSIVPYCMYHTLLEATVCTPFLGTFIQLLGGMPVPRGRNASERFTEGIKLALTKRPLVHVYPEGECFVHDQNVEKFHRGAFVVAKELNLPVFPAATVFKEPISILGWKSRRPRAEFHILEPIYPNQFENPKEFAEFTQKTVQAEIGRCNGTNRFFKGRMERIGGINAE